jgi:GT2 family glycosyltransferase
LKSFSLLSDLNFEVIVFDDASDNAVSAEQLIKNVDFYQRIEVIRTEENKGYIYARNEMAQRARTPYILSLDDDAKLFHADGIYHALEVLERDPNVGAIALSQAKEDGTLLPDYMQPSPVSYNCYAQSFIGYGHILRRDLFLKLGGYREMFQAYGEESEYCKRMLNVSSYVVYLPESKVIHYHSLIGRNRLTALRNSYRNRCFDAIYNEPFIMMVINVSLIILKYIRFYKKSCEQFNLTDSKGIQWLIKELSTKFPGLWRERRPLKWGTYRQWFNIRKKCLTYQPNSLSKQET